MDLRPRTRRPAPPSGRRDSNPRPSPWQGDALPTEPRPRDRPQGGQNAASQHWRAFQNFSRSWPASKLARRPPRQACRISPDLAATFGWARPLNPAPARRDLVRVADHVDRGDPAAVHGKRAGPTAPPVGVAHHHARGALTAVPSAPGAEGASHQQHGPRRPPRSLRAVVGRDLVRRSPRQTTSGSCRATSRRRSPSGMRPAYAATNSRCSAWVGGNRGLAWSSTCWRARAASWRTAAGVRPPTAAIVMVSILPRRRGRPACDIAWMLSAPAAPMPNGGGC